MFFVCNPLRARSWFNWREPIALGISGFIFAVTFLGLWLPFDSLAIGLISAVLVAFLAKFFWLDKMVLVIECTNRKCKEFIEIDTPWLCGYKEDGTEHQNVNTGEYPFVQECEQCHKRPKAYQCHHCKDLVYLSVDNDKQNFARRLGNIEAMIDLRVEKVTEQNDKIQGLKHNFEVAKLEKQIAIVKNLPDKPGTPEVSSSKIDVEKIAAELEQLALSKFSMKQAKIIVTARLAEYFKDQPHELKQIEPVVEDAAKILNRKNFIEGK